MERIPIGKTGLIATITDDNRLFLTHKGNITDDILSHFGAFELQTTGSNQNVHHGLKHIGTSAGSLFYVKGKEEKAYKDTVLYIFYLENKSLAVKLNYLTYANISAVRAWTEVKNISCESIGLEYVSSFSLNGIQFGGENAADEKMLVMLPHNTWCKEIDWKTYTMPQLGYRRYRSDSMKRIMAENTGTWSTKEYLPMGCAINSETGNTYLWQIENNGSWCWEIGDDSGFTYLKLSGPSETENGWWKELMPGESFESVKCAIAFSDTGYDAALAEMTKYRRTIADRPQPDKRLPVIFNDYMNCLNADPTTDRELCQIEAAAKAKCEIFCMDAGWYAQGSWWDTVGAWTVEESRFPGGIKKVFDCIKDKGMIPGIWLEPETIGICCPILDKFQETDMFMRHGKRIIDHGRYHLDFRSERVREHLTNRVDFLVSELGIGYFKFDYNIDGGIGTEVAASSAADGMLCHARAYLSWIDLIKAKHPGLIIENCASGGMRMDYSMLSHTALQSLTDASAYDDIAVIAAASGTAVIPEQAAVWCVPMANYSEKLIKLCMVSAMFKRIHLSGEFSKLEGEKNKCVCDAIKYYKSIRNEIAELIPSYPFGIPDKDSEILCVKYTGKAKSYVTLIKLKGDSDEIKLPVGRTTNASIAYGDGTIKEISNGTVTISMENSSGAVIEL